MINENRNNTCRRNFSRYTAITTYYGAKNVINKSYFSQTGVENSSQSTTPLLLHHHLAFYEKSKKEISDSKKIYF